MIEMKGMRAFLSRNGTRGAFSSGGAFHNLVTTLIAFVWHILCYI